MRGIDPILILAEAYEDVKDIEQWAKGMTSDDGGVGALEIPKMKSVIAKNLQDAIQKEDELDYKKSSQRNNVGRGDTIVYVPSYELKEIEGKKVAVKKELRLEKPKIKDS